MRFRLRTLMILLAILPPITATTARTVMYVIARIPATQCAKLIDDNRVPLTEVSGIDWTNR